MQMFSFFGLCFYASWFVCKITRKVKKKKKILENLETRNSRMDKEACKKTKRKRQRN